MLVIAVSLFLVDHSQPSFSRVAKVLALRCYLAANLSRCLLLNRATSNPRTTIFSFGFPCTCQVEKPFLTNVSIQTDILNLTHHTSVMNKRVLSPLLLNSVLCVYFLPNKKRRKPFFISLLFSFFWYCDWFVSLIFFRKCDEIRRWSSLSEGEWHRFVSAEDDSPFILLISRRLCHMTDESNVEQVFSRVWQLSEVNLDPDSVTLSLTCFR